MKNINISRLMRATFVLFVLIIAAAICLFPLLMALLNSFKTNGEMMNNILAFPKKLILTNYINTFQKMHFFRSLINTLVITGIGVSGIVIFSSMAGWKLNRTKTKLSKFIYGLFVFSMLIPFHTIMIPLSKVAIKLNINNSLHGLGIIYIGLGVSMAIFLYSGFVSTIPVELEEAARIDGCGQFATFIRIILPLLKPINMTVIVMNVLWMWNDFLLPLIILQYAKKYTLVLSTNMLFGQYTNDWTAILSALVLTAVPVVIFYMIFQKYILQGITDGAVKG